MGFSPRMYEIHLWLKDEDGDWWWEPYGAGYYSYEEATVWYDRYKNGGHTGVRIVETKIVKAYEDGIEYT
jgi:hypothetical protein